MIPCLTTARHNTLKYYDIVICSNLQLFVVVCIYLKPDGIVRLFLLGVVGLADTQEKLAEKTGSYIETTVRSNSKRSFFAIIIRT